VQFSASINASAVGAMVSASDGRPSSSVVGAATGLNSVTRPGICSADHEKDSEHAG